MTKKRSKSRAVKELAERYAKNSLEEVRDILTEMEYDDYFGRAVSAYKAGFGMSKRLLRELKYVREVKRK